MPTKKPARLPEPLHYLQSFSNALAKLPREDLNEDVDASRLVAALRKRVRGLDQEPADGKLAQDRDLLQRWLKDKPDHPAHWILGFLLAPDLATHLTQQEEPSPQGPEIVFEAPSGWEVKAGPFHLELKAGKVVGSIIAIDELTFDMLSLQREQMAKIPQPGRQAITEASDVSFGECSGKKYLLRVTAPAPWKKVDYVLRVPGGFVTISLGTMTGVEFDESPFESKLHTLRLSASSKEEGPS